MADIPDSVDEPEEVLWENYIIDTTEFGSIPLYKFNEEILRNIPKHSQIYQVLYLEYFYNFRIDAQHTLVQELTGIKRLLSGASIKTFFYFTPINMELIKEVCKPELVEKIQANIRFLEFCLEPFVVFNFISDFKSSEFISNLEKTEHLNEHGRKKLALQLKEILKK